MALPVTPDQLRALIPNPNGPSCDQFKQALLQLPEANWQNFAWMFNEDGTAISTEFAEMICTALGLIDCAGGTTGSTSSTESTASTSSTTTTLDSAVVWAVTDQQKFITVDLSNGSVAVIKTGTSSFYCLAEDPSTGILYGYVLNGANIDFVSVNKITGAETVLGASVAGFTTVPTGLTFNSDGSVLYCQLLATSGSCAGNGSIKTVNKANGALSALGSQTSRSISDIAFKSTTLFAVGQQDCNADMRLFSINVSTGAVTTVAILSPTFSAALVNEAALAYVNSVYFMTMINQIYQINTSTGVVTTVTSYDNGTNGRIIGMAKNQ